MWILWCYFLQQVVVARAAACREEGTFFSLRGSDFIGDGVGDHFGRFVGINQDGSVIAMVAPKYNDEASWRHKGLVRVLQYNHTSGEYASLGPDIIGPTTVDSYLTLSSPLSADGRTFAIGASARRPESGLRAVGWVGVYRYIEEWNRWTKIGQDLVGAAEREHFGSQLSLSADGNILAVGSYGYDGSRGQVGIYQYSNGIWLQLGDNITGTAQSSGRASRCVLSTSGTIVAIGAYAYGEIGMRWAGKVRVFRYAGDGASGSKWSQIGQDLMGSVQYGQFGWSVALSSSGTLLAVGAPGEDRLTPRTIRGRVETYRFDADTNWWIKIGQTIESSTPGDYLGSEVTLSGDGTILAVGDPQSGDGSITNLTGRVDVFTYSSELDEWIAIQDSIEGTDPRDEFGRSLALSKDGGTLVVGAPQWRIAEKGYARVFDVSRPPFQNCYNSSGIPSPSSTPFRTPTIGSPGTEDLQTMVPTPTSPSWQPSSGSTTMPPSTIPALGLTYNTTAPTETGERTEGQFAAQSAASGVTDTLRFVNGVAVAWAFHAALSS